MMNQKNRVYLWDNMKFILIFLVVLGHFSDIYVDKSPTLQSIYLGIYVFHMPAFLFVSGLFSKRTIKERHWRKLFNYMILFIFVKMMIIISNRISGGNWQFWPLNVSGMEWYAFALAVFTLIVIL